MPKIVLPFLATALTAAAAFAAPDRVIADFERSDYKGWTIEGKAFGDAPARGALSGQMAVEGFAGKGLVNTFLGGDSSTGKAISDEFVIDRKFLSFLIGGGGFAEKTCLNLLVAGKVVRTATGPNTEPGGSERLDAVGWDVTDLAGKTARLQIIDAATGGWGHINVDQIALTDQPPAQLAITPSREVAIERHWLHLPVKNGARKHKVKVRLGDQVVRFFDIELADSTPDWWAALDVSEWKGKKLTIETGRLSRDSKALEQIKQSDALPQEDSLYREALRPQVHFSAQRGWINDPNGLVFYRGEYHLFFQHNPYGWAWGNMHWGHAVSTDLVHWKEVGEALYPDELGPMFSGSAVVDHQNTSGFGSKDRPPLVLAYTAAGDPSTQCIAYSTDGRTFTKYAKNPVVKEITNGNRDPKVFWHEPSKHWVMVLYVEMPGRKHSIHFFTSTDLKEWKLASVTDGGTDRDGFLFECPDFFELPIDGNPNEKRWVLTAANSEYAIGTFDGTKFTPETGKLPGHRGAAFYAAQTFSDEPNGRRIQIGWGQIASPGMPFNQLQMFPCELSLRRTPEGPRLAWRPVAALDKLRKHSTRLEPRKLLPGEANPVSGLEIDAADIRVDFNPTPGSALNLNIRGVSVRYDSSSQEVIVQDRHVSAPLANGRQTLQIIFDRTSIEVFASDGGVYIPLPIQPKADDRSINVSASGGVVGLTSLELHQLQSVW